MPTTEKKLKVFFIDNVSRHDFHYLLFSKKTFPWFGENALTREMFKMFNWSLTVSGVC